MRIRTLFMISMVLLGLTLAIIAISMLATVRQAEHIERQETIAADIARGASRLAFLADDYLLYPEAKQRQRWEAESASIAEDVASLEPVDAEQRAIIESIRTSLDRSRTVFEGVAQAVEATSYAPGDEPADLIRVSWTRMAVQNQGVAIEAVRLAEVLRDHKTEVERRNLVLTGALLAVFTLYFAGNYTIVYRRALGAIADLQDGTRIVGSGDLDHTIPVIRDDEVGKLARAFNRMTENLKKVTASKEELETQIAERERAEAQLAAREQRLRMATDSADLGVFEWDIATGTSIGQNDRMYEILGISTETHTPITRQTFFECYLHPDDLPGFEIALESASKAGARVRTAVRVRRKDDGSWRWVDLLGTTEEDAQGMPSRIVGVARDVTQRKRAESLDQALSDMRESVTSTFDADVILRLLAEWGMTALVAASAVLSTEQRGEWAYRQPYGELAEGDTGALPPDERAAAVTAARERRPVMIEAARGTGLEDPASLERLGIGAILVVPVIAGGHAVGVMSYHFSESRELDRSEKTFATGLMNAVTLALDNAHVYQRERTIADTLQEAILAPSEQIEGLTSSFLYRPASRAANVGGDFYDLFQLDDERAVILVGDVSGKGLQAARLTSLLRDGVRAYAYENPNPGWVLQHLNHLVFRASAIESFATVFLGVLDTTDGTLRYCSAGHPPPAVVRARRVELLSEALGSSVVGAFGGVAFPVHETTLLPGELMVLYTDGVTEARSGGQLFGEQRLLEALERLRGIPVSDLPVALLNEVLTFSGEDLKDDTVILCVARMAQPDS